MKPWKTITLGFLSSGAVACGEGGSLAISAGAPVMAAVRGRIFVCGNPVEGVGVVLAVQQNRPEQARPVDIEVGPVTTDGQGRYLVELGPPFAVPGPATVQLRLSLAGSVTDLNGGTLKFALGRPPRDTLQLDADLGLSTGSC
jgi:hypothetical protein